MNALHHTALDERVYGPDLTWHVLEAAAAEDVGVFLFGSTEDTCLGFKAEIVRRFPELKVDHQSDRFRDPTPEEDAADIERTERHLPGCSRAEYRAPGSPGV